jgi:hypothetical protein
MKKFMMILMAVALLALPTMAQQQEWQSTSAMQTSGSNYTPQVNVIGAESAQQIATTTTSYSPAKGPNRMRQEESAGDGRTPGEATSGSNQSPIGDAMLPLMLCALAFGGVVALSRRREA